MITYPVVILLAVAISLIGNPANADTKNSPRVPRNLGIAGVMVAILIAGVSALRWQVGTDYSAYYRAFDKYLDEAAHDFSLTGEPGIKWIAFVSNLLGGGGATMLAIAASITWILAIRTTWKWSTTPTFAITLLLLSGAWQGSFNTVRQYVAGAIILAGHRFILERRLAPWILVVALASMFHVSAALAFLLYFVPRKRMRIPQQLAVILGAVAIFATSGEILQLIASFHEDTIEGSAAAELQINPLRVVFAFVPLIVLWVMPKPDALEEGGGWFYANMLVIYAACYVAFSDSAFLTRFTIYPQMFLAMSVTYATQYTNKTDRLAIRAIIITGFAIFMGNEIAQNDDLNNYQWIWNR